MSLSAQVISTRVPSKGSAPRSENPRRKIWLEQTYLIQPSSCEPYVKRQKKDAADAEAICEAVTRANMRFVATKTPGQQSCLMLPSSGSRLP